MLLARTKTCFYCHFGILHAGEVPRLRCAPLGMMRCIKKRGVVVGRLRRSTTTPLSLPECAVIPGEARRLFGGRSRGTELASSPKAICVLFRTCSLFIKLVSSCYLCASAGGYYPAPKRGATVLRRVNGGG